MSRIEEAIRKVQAERESAARYGRSDGTAYRQQPSRRRANDIPPESDVANVPANHVIDVDNQYLREKRVIAASEHDQRVGPYRQLRTQLLKTMRDNKWRTLAITSAHEGAGKTLTSANLAISLSRDVQTTVLLVDLDLKTPTMHNVLNLRPEKGLIDFLEGTAQLEEILFQPGLNRLTVLVGRPSGKYSSELLSSPKMQELMRDLCDHGESKITIFDLPPLLRNDDAILFAPYADATLVVVEDGVTTEEQLRQSVRLLEKANVVGTILNKARV